MKYIYILKYGQLNPTSENYVFYRIEYFSSMQKATRMLNNGIDVNNGYNIREHKDLKGNTKTKIDYTTNATSSGNALRIRMVINKEEVL